MRISLLAFLSAVPAALLSSCASSDVKAMDAPVAGPAAPALPTPNPEMDLGGFSISLNVKDIQASKAFYNNLGFTKVGGEIEQNWLILQNGAATIGLFQGAIPSNTMTFNPGWANNLDHPDEYMDVREIQRRLKAKGLTFTMEADESTEGPAFLMLSDPDGNVILMDQHR